MHITSIQSQFDIQDIYLNSIFLFLLLPYQGLERAMFILRISVMERYIYVQNDWVNMYLLLFSFHFKYQVVPRS